MNTKNLPASSWKSFLHYVIPSAGAMVLFSSYTIIDGIFVSHGVSDLAMAAVNLSLPFINVLSGIAVLLSIGISTLVAFALGQGKQEKAEQLLSQTVALIIAISVVITVIVCFGAEELAMLLGAGPLTLDYASQYLHILSLFSLCFILSYCLEVMVKVDGRPHLSAIGVGISFVMNVVLDYVFIFPLQWGIFGAALATGLAQLGSMLFFLGYFLSGKSTLRFRKFRFNWKALRSSLPLGVADCSVELILAFLILLYTRVVTAALGEAYLPIYAVISYISMMVFMVMQGLAQGMMPLVSLSIGHNDRGLARVFLKKCLICTLALSLAIVALCQLAPGLWVSLLLEGDSALYPEAVSALRQYSLSYLFTGVCIALAGYFAALGKGRASMTLSLGRGFVLLPAALLAINFLTAGQGIWMSALLGEILSLTLGLLLLRKTEQSPLAAAAQAQ